MISIWKWLKKNKNVNVNKTRIQAPDQILEEQKNKKLNTNLEETIRFIQDILGKSDDFSVRRFHVFGQYRGALVNFSNLVDQSLINVDILKPMMNVPAHLQGKKLSISELKDVLINETLYYGDIRVEAHLQKVVQAILQGESDFLVDGLGEATLLM